MAANKGRLYNIDVELSPPEVLEWYYANSRDVPFDVLARITIDAIVVKGSVVELEAILKDTDPLNSPPKVYGSFAEYIFASLYSNSPTYTCTPAQLDLVWEWIDHYPREVCRLTFRTEGWSSMSARIQDPSLMEDAIGYVLDGLFKMENVRLATRFAIDLCDAMPREPSPGVIKQFLAGIQQLARDRRRRPVLNVTILTTFLPNGRTVQLCNPRSQLQPLPLPVVVDEFISKLPSVYKTSLDATRGLTARELYLADAISPNLALVAALSVFTKGAIRTQ